MSKKLNASQGVTLGLQLGQDLSRQPRLVRDAICQMLTEMARREDAQKRQPKVVKVVGGQV